ncbi:MAG: hypothetical protein HPY84_04895 [Syntrophobacteraceae bacterium]|nr:hypothetical protein [Syntrophobacteraceae bacterium]
MRARNLRCPVWTILILSLALFVEGCSHQSGAPPPNPVMQQSQTGAPPPSSSPVTPRPQFYDFPDIPIPTELNLVQGDSYVFQSGAFKTGLLTFRGRVDINSLINFFQMAMNRENWKPKGGFRYRRSILIFEKPDRTCIIKLYEKMFYTYVEVYVAPASGQV